MDAAHETIQPLLDQIETIHGIDATEDDESGLADVLPSDEDLREALGLAPLNSMEATDSAPKNDSARSEERIAELTEKIRDQLGDAPLLKLFGKSDGAVAMESLDTGKAYIHDETIQPLLSKTVRGRREQIVQAEIWRLVDISYETSTSGLAEAVTKRILQQAFVSAALEGCRADARGPHGWKTVRPIHVQAPALPATVHGSARFQRGDTQVMCTATLGPPADGQPWSDPYSQVDTLRPKEDPLELHSAYNALPVGSMRFLRTQENLVSDLNSRRSIADKERTGESGSLAEVKRAFLQYDFPAYSTGTVPVGSQSHNRRAIGHGPWLNERYCQCYLTLMISPIPCA